MTGRSKRAIALELELPRDSKLFIRRRFRFNPLEPTQKETLGRHTRCQNLRKRWKALTQQAIHEKSAPTNPTAWRGNCQLRDDSDSPGLVGGGRESKSLNSASPSGQPFSVGARRQMGTVATNLANSYVVRDLPKRFMDLVRMTGP